MAGKGNTKKSVRPQKLQNWNSRVQGFVIPTNGSSETLIIRKDEFNGTEGITIRWFYTDMNGNLLPGKRGVRVPVNALGSIKEALEQIRNEGLLDK